MLRITDGQGHEQLRIHYRGRGRHNITAGRYEEGLYNDDIWAWQSQCNHELTAVAAACNGAAQDLICQQSITDEGGAYRALLFPTEPPTTDGLWGRGSHCLQLCSY